MICDDLAIVMGLVQEDGKPKNAKEFLRSFIYLTEDDPDIDLLDRLGYRPSSITFLQGCSYDGQDYSEIYPAKVELGVGHAPRLTIDSGDDLIPGRFFIVDVAIGRKRGLATIRELFNFGFSCFDKQIDEDPVMWRPLVEDATPCGMFHIRQHRDDSVEKLGWDIHVGSTQLSIR